MVRRTLPFLATILSLLLLLLAAAPASAYNNENRYHLRLSRLDPLKCGTSIGLQTKLTDKHGHRVSGATIHFSIVKGKSGDALSPASAVTNSKGKAVTFVTLVCTSGTHVTKVLATGPNGAKARITLVLHKHHDEDDNDHHEGDRVAAGLLAATTGSTGTGTGLAATAAGRTVVAGAAASTSPVSPPQLPVGVLLVAALMVLLAASWRRLPRRARPPTAA